MVISLISKYGCLQGVKKPKNIKIHVRKLGKSFHITNCKFFFNFQTKTFIRRDILLLESGFEPGLEPGSDKVRRKKIRENISKII